METKQKNMDDCKTIKNALQLKEANIKNQKPNKKTGGLDDKPVEDVAEYVYCPYRSKTKKENCRDTCKKKVQFNKIVEIFPTNEHCKLSTNCALKTDEEKHSLPRSKRNH